MKNSEEVNKGHIHALEGQVKGEFEYTDPTDAQEMAYKMVAKCEELQRENEELHRKVVLGEVELTEAYETITIMKENSVELTERVESLTLEFQSASTEQSEKLSNGNKLIEELSTQALAEFDSEVRFRALASAGDKKEGLDLLDKLDRRFKSI